MPLYNLKFSHCAPLSKETYENLLEDKSYCETSGGNWLGHKGPCSCGHNKYPGTDEDMGYFFVIKRGCIFNRDICAEFNGTWIPPKSPHVGYCMINNVSVDLQQLLMKKGLWRTNYIK